LVRILFLLGRDSDKAGKESIEKLIQQVHLLVQDYSNEPTALREAIRLQNLLVFAHPQESLRSLPLLLPEAKVRQQVLSAVGQLMPELLATVGAEGEFWRELHALLEVPLPGFSLTQPASETVVIPQEEPPSQPSASPQITPLPAPANVVKAPKRKAKKGTTGPKPQ
jgi:hypothetical protein